MRLTGLRVRTPLTDPDGAFVELGPYTALRGANDAGKTQLLRAVLAGGNAHGPRGVLAYHAVVEEEPLDEVVQRLKVFLWEDRDTYDPWRGACHGACGAGDLLVGGHLGANRTDGPRELVDSVFRATGLVDRKPGHWDEVAKVLAASRIVSFVVRGDGSVDPLLSLPAPVDLPAAVRETVLLSRSVDPREPVPFVSLSLDPLEIEGLADPIVLPLSDGERGALLRRSRSFRSEFGVSDSDLVMSWHATRLLPPFVADRYRIVVESDPEPGGIAIVDGITGVPFPLDQLAEGYRVWVDLAIAETSAKARDALADVRDTSVRGDEAQMEQWRRDHAALFGPDVEAAAIDLDAAADEWAETRFEMAEPSVEVAFGVGGSPLYLLDEPERNVHPALQQQAAAWLTTAMADRGAICLAATHAPAFLAVDATIARVNDVYRRGSRTEIERAPMLTEARDPRAIELGYTRGQLAEFQRGVILVEGITDKALLDGYCGDRVRELGYTVVPMGGAAKVRDTVSTYIALVPRLATHWRLVLVLDAIPDDEEALAQQLVADGAETEREVRQALKRQIASPREETLNLVQGLIQARDAGVDLQSFSIRAKDIFHLIPEDLVVSAKGRPAYPGHDQALAFIDAQRAQGQGADWKNVYERRWGLRVMDPETYRLAGVAARERGMSIPRLDVLVASLTADGGVHG